MKPTNYGPQRPGLHTEETPSDKEELFSGERLCQTCGHAATCAVRVAITTVAPEGGIEIGACGVYWPVDLHEKESDPENPD
jgi:hypothetical protein